jgi:hypothetical protein
MENMQKLCECVWGEGQEYFVEIRHVVGEPTWFGDLYKFDSHAAKEVYITVDALTPGECYSKLEDHMRDEAQRLVRETEARLTKLKGALDEVNWGRVCELYEGTGKIAAVKEYRAQTNAGLRESKEAVEERAKARGWRLPAGW